MTALLVCIFGGFGSATRFLVDSWLTQRVRGSMPLGTLTINSTGAFLVGLFAGLAPDHTLLVCLPSDAWTR